MHALKLLGITCGLLALLVAVMVPPLQAEDEAEAPPAERPKLTEHPLKDAKPGEYLRFMTDQGGWKKYYVERIIDVKEGKVLWEIFQTNNEGTKDLNMVRGDWLDVPEFKPSEHQRILSDEMVELDVNEQKLWCRHLYIEQLQNPPFPEPKLRRDVWYSNDIPCSGKVKERPGGRIVLDWGTLSADVLKQRQEYYRKREEARNKPDEEKEED